MESSNKDVPRIFVSYSHDSRDHKKWVYELSKKLMDNGVDVILDQWDLGLGDDIAKFMEVSVRTSDRVLMICTEAYTNKANDGKGGVGYEAMVVTGELIRDLGTSKFIPIARQLMRPPVLPTSLATRYYVDFCEGSNFDTEFENLLREIHQVPLIGKPEIGKNPYSISPLGNELPVEEMKIELPLPKFEREVGKEISYETALNVARSGDLVVWRRLIRYSKKNANQKLIDWRSKTEANHATTEDQLLVQSNDGIQSYSEIFAIALAGIESGREGFKNQISLMDEILFPGGWKRDGYTVIAELPLAAGYIYQALHGAMCVATDQPVLAKNMAESIIDNPYSRESVPLWKEHGVIGWPQSFAHNAKHSWDSLISLYDSWQWLEEAFGGKEDFQAALAAYYMLLNVLEYSDLLSQNKEGILKKDGVRLDIPICAFSLPDEALRRGYRLFIRNPDDIKSLWRERNISDKKVAESWNDWVSVCNSWLGGVYNYFMRVRTPHMNMVKDLKLQ